ncbi:major facilitator superfamily transporter [Apodospora peruviana]|uniref:Major facilitator superfamily transporter n=1 Tax=Apodospora peruviana TaxID=516989 RepID=A0AAE0IKA8_9PEZI|nr:major facilitator superfamily transporter [Apodospora peruviana]
MAAADLEKKEDTFTSRTPSSNPPRLGGLLDYSKIQIAHGNITDEVVLSKDGFPLFPQPVLSDELDPLNWSKTQKHIILTIVMSLYFMFTYITTTTVPSFPALQEKYAATLEQINWTVAIPALGLSLGPLLWASPADIIGRRPIIILGTTTALAATVGAALAPNYSGYMAARFFQGLGVSPASNVGLAIINDVFFEHERGQKLGLWVLAIDQGLLFGPLIGGFVSLAGYEWVQWLTAILLGLILGVEVFFLPETLYPRRLMMTLTREEWEKTTTGEDGLVAAVKRTKKLGYAHVWAPIPGMRHPNLWDTAVRFVKTWKFVVVPVSVVVYCFGWYWWVLSVVTLVPIAYAETFPEAYMQGLLYIGLIVGTVLSEVFCSGSLSDRIVVRLAKSSDDNQKVPEMRLWLAYPAAILTAVGLIVWGISVDKGYHWMVGQVAFALFGAGIQMGNTAVCSYVVDAYPMQSMATMTFYAVMLNLSAFVDPFFIVPWVENVGFTWTFAGHSIITVGFCIPLFAALHKFGPRMRRWSGEPDWKNPEFEQTT